MLVYVCVNLLVSVCENFGADAQHGGFAAGVLVCLGMRVLVSVFVYGFVPMCLHMCASVCACVRVCVCACVCVCRQTHICIPHKFEYSCIFMPC